MSSNLHLVHTVGTYGVLSQDKYFAANNSKV